MDQPNTDTSKCARRAFLKTAALSLAGASFFPTTAHESHGTGVDGSPTDLNKEFFDFSKSMPAIDSHVHLVRGLPKGWAKSEGEDGDQYKDLPIEGKATRLKVEMAQANVDVLIGMGQLGGGLNDPLGIDSALKLAGLVEGIRVNGILDSRQTSPDYLRAMEQQIERERQHLAALKVYLGYLDADIKEFDQYFKLAAKYNLPVVLHTGDTWSTRAKLRQAVPLVVDEVAVSNPGTKFIIAHMGNPWFMDAAEVIFKNDNVWGDIAGLYVGSPQSIQKIVSTSPLPRVVATFPIIHLKDALDYMDRYDRLLYGSDFPLVSCAPYRRFMEAIIPKEHHQKVFRENAEKLFGIKQTRPSTTGSSKAPVASRESEEAVSSVAGTNR